MQKICIVIPSWNAVDALGDCLDSLLKQSMKAEIVVVENGSVDGSLTFLQKHYPKVTVLPQKQNLGFAAGVNVGIRYAIAHKAEAVALFNNDAVADKDWLKNLARTLEANPKVGIVTCKLLDAGKKHLDSTGDMMTVWGLPYPRGRGEIDKGQYDNDREVFAASGGASLYRCSMLHAIGLFDEDFFAYYEDVDVSFRAQLAGWKVLYEPSAKAYHAIGQTSRKIKGFTTYQTMKNQPLLLYKNLPGVYWGPIGARFMFAHFLFFFSAIRRGQLWPALKGDARGTFLLVKKIPDRRHIQSNKVVSDESIWQLLTPDLPPNAVKLRALRAKWWRLIGKKT